MNNYKLKSCVLEMTTACCYGCRYCGSSAGKARDNELTTDEWLEVAKQLSGVGCKKVTLLGGEVFLHPGWDRLVKRLREYDIRVSIISNGYMINQPIIERMKSAGIESVAISLDGLEVLHDKYRQKGSFVAVDRAIDILVANGIPVSIISTLNSENIACLEGMYEYLQDKKIVAWQLQACCPMGNASQGFSWQIDFAEVIDFVNRHRMEAPFMLGVGHNIGYFTDDEGYLRGNPSGKAVFSGCSAGLDLIGIDSVGNVKGCESLYDETFIEGNLRERSLSEIWNDPESFKYNRQFHKKLLTGVCSTCEHGDVCAGGCRSYNYFSNNGKMYESIACAKIARKERRDLLETYPSLKEEILEIGMFNEFFLKELEEGTLSVAIKIAGNTKFCFHAKEERNELILTTDNGTHLYRKGLVREMLREKKREYAEEEIERWFKENGGI